MNTALSKNSRTWLRASSQTLKACWRKLAAGGCPGPASSLPFLRLPQCLAPASMLSSLPQSALPDGPCASHDRIVRGCPEKGSLTVDLRNASPAMPPFQSTKTILSTPSKLGKMSGDNMQSGAARPDVTAMAPEGQSLIRIPVSKTTCITNFTWLVH